MLIGVTDRTIPIFIPDPASTTGVGKTGLVAASLTVTFTRYETDNDVVTTDVTSSMNDLASLTAAHNDWGWFEVSNTLSKGQYRLDLADALFASGAWYVVVQVTITSGTAATTLKQFRLVAVNALDGVRYGLTALPNAAADAAGGLIISDAGGLDADAQLVTKINDILTDTGTTLQAELDGIQADTEDLQARTPAALVGGRMDASVGAMAANVLTASALNADAVDEIWDETIGDGTLTARQTMRVNVASLAAKLSGAATTTVTIRNVADTADVIVATVDADGNRTATTVTP